MCSYVRICGTMLLNMLVRILNTCDVDDLTYDGDPYPFSKSKLLCFVEEILMHTHRVFEIVIGYITITLYCNMGSYHLLHFMGRTQFTTLPIGKS